jgi:hypothetical protein
MEEIKRMSCGACGATGFHIEADDAVFPVVLVFECLGCNSTTRYVIQTPKMQRVWVDDSLGVTCFLEGKEPEKTTLLKDKNMDKELEYEVRANFSEALESFDFGKVYDIMNCLDWYWQGDSHPPFTIQMINMVKDELFKIAIHNFKGDETRASSGGFTVIIHESGRVRIQFIVEESYSHDGE